MLLLTSSSTTTAQQRRWSHKEPTDDNNNNGGNIINCNQMTEEIKLQVKTNIEERIFKGARRPSLSVVLYSHEPKARRFAKKLVTECAHVGIDTATKQLTPSMTNKELHDVLTDVVFNPKADAGIVVLPLKNSVKEDLIHRGLHLQKDIDGFGMRHRKYLFGTSCYLPAKVSATLEVLRRCRIKTALRTTLLHGDTANLQVLRDLICQVRHTNGPPGEKTVVYETDARTPADTLKRNALEADVIITEVGIPRAIRADMVKKGCHVIDLSHNYVDAGDGRIKVVGDTDIDEVKHVAAGVTPVPGGVGPLSIAMMCLHTLMASSKAHKGADSYR